MVWVTLQGTLKCGHRATVQLVARQDWLTIEGSPVLTEPDPVSRAVARCPNVSTNMLPCTTTTGVISGYSAFITVDGAPVVTDTLVGPTNSAPPGTYSVTAAGQDLVRES